MLNIKRPKVPNDFKKKSEKQLKKLAGQNLAGAKKFKFSESFWGNYKSYFMEAQNHRCGYCDLTITNYGDVEHYRPKSVVEEIKEPGYERGNLHNVKDRKFKNGCERGYWWLAYDWNNYLLSCSLCNQPWKRALFPISKPRAANPINGSSFPYQSPQEGDNEMALLLNPFGRKKISKHLSFTEAGLIKPYNNSKFGKHTIMTCGLDRISLTQKRSRIASRAIRFINKFADAPEGSERELEIIVDLLDMGHVESDHAGMIRVIFEQKSDGFTWKDLENYHKEL